MHVGLEMQGQRTLPNKATQGHRTLKSAKVVLTVNKDFERFALPFKNILSPHPASPESPLALRMYRKITTFRVPLDP